MNPCRGRAPGSIGGAPIGWTPFGSRRSALVRDPRLGFAARIGGFRFNRLLRDAGDRRLAVLVNDFGAINIDADLVRSRRGMWSA